MAKLYRYFHWKKGEEGILLGTPDEKFEFWSIKLNTAAKPWKKGDKSKYNTEYMEEFDTDKIPFIDLLNIVSKLNVEEVKELLEQDEWLKEPFMMFIANPFSNKEIKEQWEKIKNDIEAAKSSANTASFLSFMDFWIN